MQNRRVWPSVIVGFIAVLLILSPTFAADRPKVAAVQRSPVDQVSVRGGLKLRGMLFAQGEDKSVTLLTSAKWLKGGECRMVRNSASQDA